MITVIMTISCTNEELTDLTPPQIDVDSPENGQKFAAGSVIPFEAVFTDNLGLGTYSIDIHNAFDSHGHGRKAEDPDLIKFSFKDNYELPETTAFVAVLPEEIVVPPNTMAGPYHFIVQAIDAEGNATSYQDGSIVELEILITNESMAVIEIMNLVNDELEIEASLPFTVEGTITDPPHPDLQGIEEVFISLGEPEGESEQDHGRKAETLYEINLEGSGLDPYYNQEGSLDISAMIDFTLSEQELVELLAEGIEHLELKIEAHDMQGNISIEIIPVHIHID